MSNNTVAVDKPRATGGLFFACLLNVGISGLNAVANVVGAMIVVLFLPALAADLFLMGRRVAVVLASLLQCGGSQSLQKYLSFFSNNPSKKLSFECVALSLWMIGSCAVVSLAFLCPGVATRFITNNGEPNLQLVLSVVSLGSALAIGQLAVATLLAERKIIFSGFCTLLTGPLLMLLAVIIFARQENVPAMLFVQAFFMALVAIVIITSYVYRWKALQRKETKSISLPIREFKQAVAFGLPRTVSSSAEYILLSVAPWYLTSVPGKASAFITATILVRSLQILVTPVSQIFSLSVAQLKSTDDLKFIDKKIYRLARVLWLSGMMLAGAVWVGNYLFLDSIFRDVSCRADIKYFIGLICWAIPPSIIFYSFRNIIEMRWVFPFNVIILGVALGVEVVIVKLFPHVELCFLVGLAFVLSFWLCGIGTMIVLWLGVQSSGSRPAIDVENSTAKIL